MRTGNRYRQGNASSARFDEEARRRSTFSIDRALIGAGLTGRTEKGRLVSQTTFPVLRQPHISGRFQNLCTGGLFPGRILIGDRCKSGQSRLDPDTDAMVSHLRKMSPLNRHYANSARWCQGMSPLIPLFTGSMAVVEGACNRRAIAQRAAMTTVSASRRPGLVVAGRRGAAAAGECRAGGAIGRRRAGHVGNMRLFPFPRRVALLGRSDIDGVMQPAMP